MISTAFKGLSYFCIYCVASTFDPIESLSKLEITMIGMDGICIRYTYKYVVNVKFSSPHVSISEAEAD